MMPLNEKILKRGRRCLKCGHEWLSYTEKPPKLCPKCKSTKWNDRVRE